MKLNVHLLVAVLLGATQAFAQVDPTEIDFTKSCSFTLKRNNVRDIAPVYFIQLRVNESTQYVGIARKLQGGDGRLYDSSPRWMTCLPFQIN